MRLNRLANAARDFFSVVRKEVTRDVKRFAKRSEQTMHDAYHRLHDENDLSNAIEAAIAAHKAFLKPLHSARDDQRYRSAIATLAVYGISEQEFLEENFK